MTIMQKPPSIGEGECRHDLNFELPKYGAVPTDYRYLPDGSYRVEWQDCLGIAHVTASSTPREATDRAIEMARKVAENQPQ